MVGGARRYNRYARPILREPPMSGPTPAPPWRGASAPTPTPPGPPWRAPTPRAPYRPRWRRLALVAALALAALAAVTWVVFWIRPPAPARVVILHAGYDRTLAVPPNPYGKADARELATLARPGSWLGTRSRLTGGPTSTLSRTGLPDLSAVREKCVVVFVAAHGGRDRDGPFLFPEDSDGSPADRVRFKTLLEQLTRLPASKQKLLIIDATHAPAFADLGLVHNDFAAAVEEMDAEIAAVPNLAVFLSSGLDERSWTSPEWGTSAFAHFALAGLNGGADADGNKRVTASELIAYVTPRVSDWARDNRGARQVPVLLPKADGADRVRDMHLVSVDGQPAATTAPEPFEPPPELETQWKEYRELAHATPPPTAYTPHLWRQYEAWVLRHEEHILANDSDGAKVARANAAEVRRKIEAARTLDVSPQTLALQAAAGGHSYSNEIPESVKLGIASLVREPAASRARLWADLRAAHGDTEASRLIFCRALIEWTASDPVPRLPIARDLVPLVGDGFAIRPAELNFLAMLAKHLPPPDKKEAIGPLLTKILLLRLKAEQVAAACEPDRSGKTPYPFAEYVYPYLDRSVSDDDAVRREAEDRCFATAVADWDRALATLEREKPFDPRLAGTVDSARITLVAWHRGAHSQPGEAEWAARRLNSAAAPFAQPRTWARLHTAGWLAPLLPVWPQVEMIPAVLAAGAFLTEESAGREGVAIDTDELLKSKPEFDAISTPRADVVKWLHRAEAVFTAPPPDVSAPAQRVALAREYRRVSRQLFITGETRPEPLPEVSPAKAREIAFESAKRRGELLLGRLGGTEVIPTLSAVRAGEEFGPLNDRLETFAFRADGRQSLAIFGSRCAELFAAAAERANWAGGHLGADRWIRILPAHAPVSDTPIDRARRERVRGYLAWQAGRTFADHWYGEGGSRYYHLAAQRLASDAASIVTYPPTDDPFNPSLGAERPFPVMPKLPARFAITDELEPRVRVLFETRRFNGIPVEGFPVFWIDPQSREPISTKPSDATLVRSLTRPAPPQPLTPKAQTQPLAVTGFFRGRTHDASTSVDFYAVPDRAAVSVAIPQHVGIAVRADANARKRYGFGTGAVAIVLDCSGSMGRDPKDPTSVGLYPEALEALAKLLAGLPPGTTVTVWTFGQKTQGIKTPEETIRELLPPTELPLDAGVLIEDVLRVARGLEPWHESPVVRAAVTAKNRIKDAKVPFKAVVLLSDAVDNRFAVDPDYGEKKRAIGDVLRAEFPPAEVAFGVVAFPVVKEEQAAQAEFKIVEKLIPAGKFVTPEKVQDLIDWLRTGLNPRVRFTLEPLTSDTPAPGALFAGTAETDNWYAGKLAPSAYRLRVVGDAKLVSDIALSPGDRLLLDLTEDSGKLSLQRHWFADTVPAVAKAGAPEAAWRFSLLQNRAKAGKLELFSAIDGNPDIVNRLSPTRIGDVWFEVTPSVPQPEPVAIRWRAEGGFPAPCWSLDSPAWPAFPGTAAPAAPRLSAWWWPRKLPSSLQVLPAEDAGLLSIRDRHLGVVGAWIESVTLEEHELEVAPAERQKRTCLVVRMRHPEGNPVFARLDKFAPTASEVRIYKAANKTTCLFWWPGLDAASVKEKVYGFEFVPLNDALREAEKAGRHLTLPAPAPTDTSARPELPTK